MKEMEKLTYKTQREFINEVADSKKPFFKLDQHYDIAMRKLKELERDLIEV